MHCLKNSWLRTILTCGLLLGLAGRVIPSFSMAAPKIPRTVETSGLEFITPPAQNAIDRGLAYLAKNQNEDGSFGSGVSFGHNAAITGLAGLAFMSAGSSPNRGPYGQQVDRALKYILDHVAANGFISPDGTNSHGPMYDHGFATLFLAEVYGMTQREDVREKLTRAVKLIITSQNREGGWRYMPVRNDADVSVTVCQIMALRAARNCGIYVPKDTVDACVKYVEKCQNPADGGFKYQLLSGSPSAFPRSAAGVVALYSAGIYEGRTIERGLAYLEQHIPTNDVMRLESNFYYGHYYAVQAMWQAGGKHWNRWYPAVREVMISQQLPDGSWTDSIGSEYATAMACITLQMPNSYLPIFQR